MLNCIRVKYPEVDIKVLNIIITFVKINNTVKVISKQMQSSILDGNQMEIPTELFNRAKCMAIKILEDKYERNRI